MHLLTDTHPQVGDEIPSCCHFRDLGSGYFNSCNPILELLQFNHASIRCLLSFKKYLWALGDRNISVAAEDSFPVSFPKPNLMEINNTVFVLRLKPSFTGK